MTQLRAMSSRCAGFQLFYWASGGVWSVGFFEKSNCRGFWIAAMLSVIVAPRAATAFMVDWDTIAWPGGTGNLTNTYVNVDASAWDVQVQIIDPDSNLIQIPDASPASPSTNTHLDPPTNTGDNLFVRADTNGGGAGITIRFDFTHSTLTDVTNITLSLFDVDTSDAPSTQWIDNISITGYQSGGGSVLPDSVVSPTGTPTWTYNALTGTLLGDVTQGNAGNADDNGTAIVTFNGPIAAIEFTYLNDFAPGGNQWIAFSDVAFIPEPNTFLLMSLGLIGLSIRRRRV